MGFDSPEHNQGGLNALDARARLFYSAIILLIIVSYFSLWF